MKRILKIAVPAVLLMLGSMIRTPASAQASVNVSYQTFYDELSPYGQWIDYPEYGYVWSPDAGDDFRPYGTNGHWVWSDEYEWTWVSDYDWGWATFHYGRWQYDDYYGWLWVPGYEWAPAWVAWRSGGDYYGWAPLRPGFNISISFGNYNPPDYYWYFAPRRYISSPRIYDYCIDRRQNTVIIHNTIFINNNNNYRYRNVYVNGPRRDECERYTGRLTPVRFRDSYRPGRTTFRDNEVSVYRPRVQQDNTRRFAPRQFERFDRQRTNDTRTGSNDNNLRRNNDVTTDRGNNLPTRRNDNSIRRDDNNNVRRDDNNNGRFERKDNNIVRQPRNDNNDIRPPRVDNTPRENGRIERKDNEVIRQRDNGNNQFERRQPVIERKVENKPIERRIENKPVERRVENRPIERRVENNNRQPQQPRQFERRQEEKKDNGNNGNNGNNGRGNGKRRN